MKKFSVYSLLLLILCLGLSNMGVAQSYRVEVTLTGRTSSNGCIASLDNAFITLGGQTVDTEVESVPLPTKVFDKTYTSRPTSNLTITGRITGSGCAHESGRCNPGDSFNGSLSINWSSFMACNVQTMRAEGICNDDNTTVTVTLSFQVKWTPIHSPDRVQVSESDVCEHESVGLSVASSLTGYTWRFRDTANPTFRPLNTSHTGNLISVSIDEIYGASYGEDKLGTANNIFFEAKIGGCVALTSANPVHYQPGPPGVPSEALGGFSLTRPECSGIPDSVIVNNLSRSRFPGETFNIKIFNRNDNVSIAIPVAEKPSIIAFPVTFTNLSAGDYKFLVTSNLQCMDVREHEYPKTNFTISNFEPVSATPAVTHVSCFGGSNGSITVTAAGGSGSGYEYAIKDRTGYGPGNVFSPLSMGSYTLLVKDNRGCTSAETPVSVTEPIEVRITAANSPYIYRGSQISCFGASDATINITATGGTGALEYSVNSTDFYPTPTFTGIGAGTYTAYVHDANGCTKTFPDVVVTPPLPITATATPVNPLCFSDPAAINVTASGGTGVLQYSLDDSHYDLSPPFINLPLSAYTVYIRDENFCKVTRPVTITRPQEMVITLGTTTVTCFGYTDGSLTLNVTQGTSPYTYSFNNGEFQSSNTLDRIGATNHTFVVRDNNGCQKGGNINVPSNPLITGTITVQNPVSCNGSADGVLNLTPNGGVLPYTYAWSNGSLVQDPSGLIAGPYTVTVTDSKGCSKEFTQPLGQPSLIVPTYATSDYNGRQIRCFGDLNGSIDLSVTGGNGGFTYTWSNGSTTQDLTSLSAGTYTVTIKDSKNCPGNASVILTQPPQLVAVLTAQQNVLCFGGNTGSISLNSLGGTGAHAYSINSGSNWQVAPSFATLAANNYTILTRDINNCQASLNVAVTSPSDILLSVSNIVNTTCNQNNGSAQASATGGVASYTYEWFNSGNTSIGTTPTINSLPADTYRVVVTDQNACTKQQTVPISSSNGPQVTTGIITPATCSDTADGTASISITGGSTPYTILWPNGQTTSTATSLAGGEYIVEVRDNTSCLALQAITVPAPDALIINTLNKEDPNCNGNSDGMITLEATGGNGTYSYTWNTGATTPTLMNLAAGTYTVTVKDVKNCTEEEQIILIDPPVFTIDLGADQKICEGMTVILNAPAAGTYAWSSDNGFTSDQSSVSLTEAGIYTLNVISPAGCEAEDNFVLSYDADLLKADFLMTSQAHAGDTIVLIDISWPLPEQIIWTYDASAAVIEETQDYSMIRFDDAGEYLISLFARLAQCSNHYEQSIIILEAEVEEETQGKSHEKLFEHISAYPNPSPDEVSVSVELSKSKTISLELYQAESNKQVYKETLGAERAHVKALNLSMLPRGMYILYIRAGKEIKTIKILKQ